MKPRVLFFCPVPDFKGGAEIVLSDMLGNPAITPLLAVPESGPVADAAIASNVPVAFVSFGAITKIHRPLRLRSVINAVRDTFMAAHNLKMAANTMRADIIHSNGMKAHFIAVLAKFIGSPSIVVHIHDLPIYKSERFLWRILAKIATRTIIVSHACWPNAILPKTVSVVHNGFEPKKLFTKSDTRSPVVVGFCGRLHPFKGLHLLPEWLAACHRAGLDVKLIIRGEAASEHHQYVTRIKQEFAELGLIDAVDFQGRKTGLDAIFGGLHVVVVPSDTPDPLPRSVMEAMGLGLPVIGYPAGGIPEMIEHNTNGWLVSNSKEFVQVLRIVADDPAHYERIRDAAIKTIGKHFSIEAMYTKLNDIYEAAMKQNKKR